MIVGVDEVGRGPWAGPVVAAAVALPTAILGLDDSKKLTARRRFELDREIRALGHIGIGAASVGEIDRLNILHASLLAMVRAVEGLSAPITEVLVDGNRLPQWRYRSRAIVGGDGKIAEIGAASIIAKVLRDRLMAQLDTRYPGYGWASNAGYGTKRHREGLTRLGVTPHHRRTFKPILALTYAS